MLWVKVLSYDRRVTLINLNIYRFTCRVASLCLTGVEDRPGSGSAWPASSLSGRDPSPTDAPLPILTPDRQTDRQKEKERGGQARWWRQWQQVTTGAIWHTWPCDTEICYITAPEVVFAEIWENKVLDFIQKNKCKVDFGFYKKWNWFSARLSDVFYL